MPVEVLTSSGQDLPPPIGTRPGRLREWLRDSLWVVWTFTLFFDWVAFLWIGFRAQNRRWLLWGIVYAIPFAALLALDEELYESWPGDLAVLAVLVLGVISIVHAIVVRPAYIVQRRARSRERRRRRVLAFLALALDLLAWVVFAWSWTLEGWDLAGAWIVAFFLVSSGALLATLGIVAAALGARYRGERLGPNIRTGLIALGTSLGSFVLFVAVTELVISATS